MLRDIFRSRTRIRIVLHAISIISILIELITILYFSNTNGVIIHNNSLRYYSFNIFLSIALIINIALFIEHLIIIKDSINNLMKYNIFTKAPSIWLGAFILDNEEELVPIFINKSKEFNRKLCIKECKRIINICNS